MSRLIAEITAEQIDDWFKIGKKNVKIKSIPKSTTGGRFVDPVTMKPKQLDADQHVPHFKRQHGRYSNQEYAEEYKKEEEAQLLGRRMTFDDPVSEVSSCLDALERDSMTTAPIALASDLAPDNATEVYSHYDFTRHQTDTKLPIAKYKDQLIATIESNQVTVIQGSTGSGKTTQVPQYILDHYAQQGKYCNIIITQPRRIAAKSIADRVCHERGWQTGTVCGYQVSLDRVANDDTRILYCTVGILLQKLVSAKHMQEYTHVILDEVHERDQDTDFSLLIVRKLLNTNSRHTRVVIMSATFESKLFADYFALPVRDKLEQAPVVNVEGKPFQVGEFYAEDLTSLCSVPVLEEGNPEISAEARNMAIALIQEFDKLEAKEQAVGPSGFALVRGTVLVFLPGEHEIKKMQQALDRLQLSHQLWILPLHSTITMDEQSQVFRPCPQGQRKVILSTNIAESSITVPDIKYVIDFCLTKNLVCDFETNYTSLQENWASKASCTQRKGRSGRVSNGRVYRLVTRLFYETFIPDYGTPEMQRCPLDKLILQVKKLDMGQPKAILALALSPPNLDDIERNIIMLKEVGALSILRLHTENRHDGKLTFVGQVLASLPVDPHIGKLIILGHVFGLLEECMIIGAAMSLKSMFARPFRKRLEAYRHKLGWSHGSLSDSIAILHAYKSWERNKSTGAFRRSGDGELGWGKKYFLQIRRLKEISELVTDIEKRLVKFNILKPKHPPNYKKEITTDQEQLLLKMVICGAFYPGYFVRGEIDELECLKSMSGRDPLNHVMVKGLPANQGTLYKQTVEDQFRDCEANPKAYFEETRAYVEFPWKPNRVSRVHQGVYMACKMQQLRMPINIDLLTMEEASAMMKNLELSQTANMVPGQLRTNRLTVSNSITEESGTSRVGILLPPPAPDTSVTYLFITEIVDCGYFWAQYHEEENFQQLRHIHTALNNSGTVLQPIRGLVRVGSFCVAPFQDESLEYYRARVHSVNREYDERLRAHRDYVEVFFVDYGNFSQVPKEELRELPNELLQIPFQAVECRLRGIRPSPIKCPDGRWTDESKETFKRLVSNTVLMAQVYSIVHGVLRVDLVKKLSADIPQTFIAQVLINQGYADEAEESFTSKQNHELRREELKKKDTGQPVAASSTQEDWLHVSLDNYTSTKTPASRQSGSRITLHGPTNPYQMNFYGITNSGRLRPTKIDQESVNSIAIDDEPEDPHQRLMVSGFISLNPNGSTVVARDTTIMPLIPGIPALVLLLFSPVAELRTDPKKMSYTGALCGLGVDPHSGYAAYPDHDIEMAFDVKLDLEDIYKINGVRMAISIAVGSADSVATWGADAVYKLQLSARKKILDLIQRRRETVEPYTFPRPHHWNQVDPNDVMEPGIDHQDWPVLYTSHSAIALNEDIEEGDAETHYYKRHMKDLHEISRSGKHTTTLCELCNVTSRSSQLLGLHLVTSSHLALEEKYTKQT